MNPDRVPVPKVSAEPSAGFLGRSLRRQLLVVFGSAMGLLLVVSLAGIFFLVRTTERQGWIGRQHEATQRVVHTVGEFMQRQQEVLRTVDLLAGDQPGDTGATLTQLLREQPIIKELIQVDADGRVLARASTDAPVLADLFTVAQANWFVTARRGDTYIGDMQLSAATEPYAVFAVPASRGGVIACRLRVDRFSQLVAELHFGRGGISYLVSREGRVIAHSGSRLIPGAHEQGHHHHLLDLIRTTVDSWSGTYQNFNGHWVVGTIAAVPGTPWMAVTELPLEEAHAASWRALWTLFIAGLIITATLTVLVTWLLKRQFLGPLEQLQQGVTQIGHGALDHRIVLAGPSEYLHLAGAFNHMAATLQQREAQLAEQNRAMQASEARYRAIVEDQTELVCRYLPTGDITFANEAFCRYFDRPRDQLDGVDCRQMLSPDNPEAALRLLDTLCPAHPVARSEHRLVRPDGEIRWLHWTNRAIFDDRGNLVEYAGVGHDVTERKQTAEALLRTKEEAEAANRAKSRFLANMSHEIRTPLNAIIGMTHLAMHTREDDKRQRFLATVAHAADSLLGLLNDILDISKMEAGQLSLATEPFDPRRLVEASVATLAAQASEKGLDLRLHLGPALPDCLLGDALRLRQILLNLLGNAVKFTPAGTITLEAFAEEAEDADNRVYLHLRVTDTGIGIPAEKLELIFNRFEQADNSYGRQYGGAGLGLSISAQLAALMHGRLWAESRENQGSTFHCLIPFPRCAWLAEANGADNETGTAPAVSRLRILVVDDNEVNRDVAAMTLERNHAVTTADNGLEALRTLAAEPVDLVLMDVQMPVMDGLATTTVIRAIEQGRPLPVELPDNLGPALAARLTGRRLPIMAMTAHAMDGDRDMCLQAGMDAYVTKPFQPDQLTMVVGSLALSRPDDAERAAVDAPQQPPAVSVPQSVEPTAEAVTAYLLATTLLETDQVAKILAAVRTSMAEHLDAADHAFRTDDLDGVARAAHTLKGTLMQCGLEVWARMAQEIVAAIRITQVLPPADLLADLRQGLAELLAPERPADSGGQTTPSRPHTVA